jgi:hypothetical protein
MNRMPHYNALSFGDRWRVLASLRRGEAPSDPRLAAAAVELGEASQRQGRGPLLIFWFPLAVAICTAAAALLFVVQGDPLLAGANVLVTVVNFAHLAISPLSRPANVARSLRASRDAVASS